MVATAPPGSARHPGSGPIFRKRLWPELFMTPALASTPTAAPRRRSRRWCASPRVHCAYILLATAALWSSWSLEPYLWAFAVLGLSLLTPLPLLAAGLAILFDRRDGYRLPEHTILAWLHGALLLQLAWHWIVLLDTPFGC